VQGEEREEGEQEEGGAGGISLDFPGSDSEGPEKVLLYLRDSLIQGS